MDLTQITSGYIWVIIEESPGIDTDGILNETVNDSLDANIYMEVEEHIDNLLQELQDTNEIEWVPDFRGWFTIHAANMYYQTGSAL